MCGRRRAGLRITVTLVLPLVACAAAALAQAPADDQGLAIQSPSGEDLTVSVLTFGPGDHPFYKFGHDALWLHDTRTGRDDVYNYGTFAFDRPALVLEFLAGRFSYWLSRDGLDETLRDYREDQRAILSQELELTPAQRLLVWQRLVDNARPENRAYKYDYYRDNCTTRVRDVIDGVTNGAVRQASSGMSTMTYRDHTLRLTEDAVIENVALDLALGPRVDRPLSRWDEAFLPDKLAEALRRSRVLRGGLEVPLVRAESVLFQPDRAPPPEAPSGWTGRMALAGLAAGGALAGLGSAARRSRAARVAFGVLLAAIGAVFGSLGSFFVAAWAFTDHEAGYRNENALACAPFALSLLVIGIGVAAGARWGIRAARWVTACALASALLGLAIKILPFATQHNARVIALMLPMWAGAAFGARLLAHGGSPARDR